MMDRILAKVILLVVLPTSVSAWTKREDAHGKTIIAYYASWQWYDRDSLAKPSNLDHSKVTRYNFAFFQTNERGDIWGTDGWADSIVLFGEHDWNGAGQQYCSWDTADEPPVCSAHKYETGLISQAHSAGVEVYPSIGGWSLSSLFPTLAANPTARVDFANNCVRLIEAYDFDGIDIDWEFPGYADHMGTPEDTVNYSLFLEEIRKALDVLGQTKGRTYGLTAALPCGADLIRNIQIDVVSNYLDELNLMTYDFHGTWNTETGANAPLYDMEGSPGLSVHSCVEMWKQGGGDQPLKINIGLPFYGRSFAGTGLTGFGQSHVGSADTISWSADDGSPQYFNLMAGLASFTTGWDEQTKTAYAYSSTGFLSYDDERAICDKTEYAVDNQLNGFIIWEISGDLLEDLSTPLLDVVNGRLNDPTVRCESRDANPANNAEASSEGNSPISPPIPSPTPGPIIMNPALVNVVATETTPTLIAQGPTSQLTPRPMSGVNPALTDGELSVKNNPAPVNLVDTVTSPMAGGKPTLTDGELSVSQSTTGNWDVIQKFYPYYGVSEDCRNDGNAPTWITKNMMKASKSECCTSYFFSSSLDHCNASHPWYPNFQEKSCVNDGKQPKWMSGSYLVKTIAVCCQNFFRDTESQQRCNSVGR